MLVRLAQVFVSFGKPGLQECQHLWDFEVFSGFRALGFRGLGRLRLLEPNGFKLPV